MKQGRARRNPSILKIVKHASRTLHWWLGLQPTPSCNLVTGLGDFFTGGVSVFQTQATPISKLPSSPQETGPDSILFQKFVPCPKKFLLVLLPK
jgi:hypothetical protein